MTGHGNGARRFEVHCSTAITDLIRHVHRRAWRQGRSKPVTSAFRQLIRRPEREPLQFGEAAYRLPGLRLQVRTAIVRPLVVDFAISEDQPLVFIKGIKLLSGS